MLMLMFYYQNANLRLNVKIIQINSIYWELYMNGRLALKFKITVPVRKNFSVCMQAPLSHHRHSHDPRTKIPYQQINGISQLKKFINKKFV